MKILLNSVAAKGGGGITYIRSFLECAARMKPEWGFVALLPPIAISEILPLPANVRLIATEIGYAPWWKRVWWDQVNFRRLVRREKADVLYSTANFGVVACPVPQILQILNPVYSSRLFHERYLSHSFSDKLSFRLRRGLLCQSVRSADIVMTPTAATLAEVRRYVKVPPERALVNPLGVEDPEPAGASTAPSPGPGEPFRLSYVSYYRAHKNLTTLLQALRELQSKGQRAYRLITNLDPDSGDGLWASTSHQDRSLLADPLIAPAVEMARPSTHAEALALYK